MLRTFWELLAARLTRPVDGVMPRPVALRLGALLHDVAKPQTRAVDEQGRVMFWGHTELGGPVAEGICARLRCSTSATSLVRRWSSGTSTSASCSTRIP